MDWAKKDCILLAAGKAFARWGFRKTSVDQIAKTAGVAKGTVYNACESKEDLFYQVLHREVRAWVADVSKVVDPSMPADQLLAVTADRGLAYLEDRPLVKDLLFRQAHDLIPSLSEKLDALCELGIDNVIAILRLGQKQGIFREDLDVPTTATLLQDLSLAFFVLHDTDRPDRDEIMNKRRDAALSLVLHGIRS